MNLKFTYLKMLSNITGANELMLCARELEQLEYQNKQMQQSMGSMYA